MVLCEQILILNLKASVSCFQNEAMSRNLERWCAARSKRHYAQLYLHPGNSQRESVGRRQLRYLRCPDVIAVRVYVESIRQFVPQFSSNAVTAT